jgi:hypothetical protein
VSVDEGTRQSANENASGNSEDNVDEGNKLPSHTVNETTSMTSEDAAEWKAYLTEVKRD